MKTILITTTAALLASSAPVPAEPNPVAAVPAPAAKEETFREKAREFWIKSKGYLSDDATTYKQGAQQTLTDLGKQIDEVTTKAGEPPQYFQTRLQALRQQQGYLLQRLNSLTAEAIKTRMSGPRYAFDRCVASLEKAIDQADDEAEVLAKVNSPEKRAAK